LEVSIPARKPEPGRGEKVMPGLWRLRLPLPWPLVPHGNAWAVADGDGLLLIDTGIFSDTSIRELERALDQCGLSLDSVKRVACTHAHADHAGQAATIAERTGAEILMNPATGHMKSYVGDPDGVLDQRLERALRCGVPEDTVERQREARRGVTTGFERIPEVDGDLVDGVVVPSDLGDLVVVETPGHAPSHVCLHQAERRILFSGDHLLGRVSLYYDVGYTPDPAGEFLASLDKVSKLDARLCLAGHGKPVSAIPELIAANRAAVDGRMAAIRAALGGGSKTAWELTSSIYEGMPEEPRLGWFLPETLAYLTHLELLGEVVRRPAGEVEMWALAAAGDAS
jgi:glyoxylase-like metal-dependent hydrolase (beta-lactamase superfamily II)